MYDIKRQRACLRAKMWKYIRPEGKVRILVTGKTDCHRRTEGPGEWMECDAAAGSELTRVRKFIIAL